MKYLKLQQDIIKEYDKKVYGKKNKIASVAYGVNNNRIGITLDSTALYIIPEEMCVINLESITNGRTPIDSLVSKMESASFEAHDGILANNREVLPDKRVLAFIKDDFTYVAIDTALFKYLDLEETHFKITNKVSPIYAYERDRLVAVFMPVKY